MSTTATAPMTARKTTRKTSDCPAYCDPNLCTDAGEGDIIHYSKMHQYEGKLYDMTVQWSRASFERRGRVLLNIQTQQDLTTKELRVLIKDLEDLAGKMDALKCIKVLTHLN
ncbi:hypothetical protein [Kocuria sp. U4B]